MAFPYISIFLLIVTAFHISADSCKGCVDLDEYNFDKVIDKFDVVIVKFDVAFPYGDKHETFAKLSLELADNPQVIFASVGVKDYGEKENEMLANKYGIKTKDDLPAIRVFIKDHKGRKTKEYPNDSDWTADGLRKFIRNNTPIYVGLPGCLKEFDELSLKFISLDQNQGGRVLEEAEKLRKTITNLVDGDAADVYIKFMKKIIASGVEFVENERKRLAKLLKVGQINEKKKLQLSHRLNILRSFETAPLNDKQEL